MKVEFHPAAAEELVETTAFYERRVSGLGMGFILEVERVVDLVQAHPLVGQRIEEAFRRIVLVRFPYSLIYSVEADRIWIVAVAHHRRQPGYWRERSDR
jgi:plasmid stabilization system protein ParE